MNENLIRYKNTDIHCTHKIEMNVTEQMQNGEIYYGSPSLEFYLEFRNDGRLDMYVTGGQCATLEFPKINYCPACGAKLQPNPDMAGMRVCGSIETE